MASAESTDETEDVDGPDGKDGSAADRGPGADGRTFRIPLTIMESHPCVYLAGREARMRGVGAWHLSGQSARETTADHESDFSAGLSTSRVPGELFEAMLNGGFRRSGDVFYQPACEGCSACIPLRINVEQFHPSKSQRRILRKCADLRISIGQPVFSPEKQGLYTRYLAGQHEPQPEESEDTLESFLYASPVTTVEITYRDAAEKLVAVGICDVTQSVWSSVYFYWDPADFHRSLGIFGVLTELHLARLQGRAWYHLGYWVKGAKTMSYKAAIADHELLGARGKWESASRQVGYGSAE